MSSDRTPLDVLDDVIENQCAFPMTGQQHAELRAAREDFEMVVIAAQLAEGFLKNRGYSEKDPLVRGALIHALRRFNPGGGNV